MMAERAQGVDHLIDVDALPVAGARAMVIQNSHQ
jgi:hypothetical protein